MPEYAVLMLLEFYESHPDYPDGKPQAVENMLLSQTQKRVMAWVGNGEVARTQSEETITIGQTSSCKLETMMTLQRLGLVMTDIDGNWIATESGKTLATQMRL